MLPQWLKKLFVTFICCNVDCGAFLDFVLDIFVNLRRIDARCFELKVFYRRINVSKR